MMRVTLIEDDTLVRETILGALEAEGMEVEDLANAEDAVVLLDSGQVPDVLVAEVNLGAGLSRSDLAGVLISGMPVGDNAGRLFQQRHGRFLRKPFAAELLSRPVREAAGDVTACPG